MSAHKGVSLPPLRFIESPNQSNRFPGVPLDLIVLHDTEGGYEGAIKWFQNRHSAVSAHLVLSEDGKRCVQMVPFKQKAWHCATFNSRSIGIEMAGFLDHESEAQMARAARITAFLLHKLGLPAHASIRSGFCRHRDLGAAGGSHVDPMGDHKWKHMVELVKFEAQRNKFRASWGRW
jgi:N-acetyl-anhydromuramyl-L-alanine amidase AmpD